jgi:putative crossover junction endodeoxyribonuclease
MVDQVAAVNILQYSLDALKAGQAVAGYLVHESPREDSHLQETIDGPVNETENLQ